MKKKIVREGFTSIELAKEDVFVFPTIRIEDGQGLTLTLEEFMDLKTLMDKHYNSIIRFIAKHENEDEINAR